MSTFWSTMNGPPFSKLNQPQKSHLFGECCAAYIVLCLVTYILSESGFSAGTRAKSVFQIVVASFQRQSSELISLNWRALDLFLCPFLCRTIRLTGMAVPYAWFATWRTHHADWSTSDALLPCLSFTSGWRTYVRYVCVHNASTFSHTHGFFEKC